MKRTDLALEIREQIKGPREISGVRLEKHRDSTKKVQVTNMEILNEEGSKIIGKPKGSYITIELLDEKEEEALQKVFMQTLQQLLGARTRIFVVGLGNRDITPDALGPWTVDEIMVTRHILKEYGAAFSEKYGWSEIEGLAPGVMAQTGMEVQEILQGVVKQTKPEVVLVFDALAARSMKRLGNTIQITNTGIHPGAGVGNNRKALTKETLGIEVIAIGVPTVVDAQTLAEDYMEEGLRRMGLTEEEIKTFLQNTQNEKMKGMFMAGKDIDQQVRKMSKILSNAINHVTGVCKIE